jgi:hypothetical protein
MLDTSGDGDLSRKELTLGLFRKFFARLVSFLCIVLFYYYCMLMCFISVVCLFLWYTLVSFLCIVLHEHWHAVSMHVLI